jgi:uncharacterized protein YcsI (UPF0317 family)
VGNQQIRNNEYSGATSELACGFVLAQLVILPGEYALDFLKFCVRNPKLCPILEITEAGDPWAYGRGPQCGPSNRCS